MSLPTSRQREPHRAPTAERASSSTDGEEGIGGRCGKERKSTTYLLPLLLALLQPRRKLRHPLLFILDLPKPKLQPRWHVDVPVRGDSVGKVGRGVETVVGAGGELLDEGLDRWQGNPICMSRKPTERTNKEKKKVNPVAFLNSRSISESESKTRQKGRTSDGFFVPFLFVHLLRIFTCRRKAGHDRRHERGLDVFGEFQERERPALHERRKSRNWHARRFSVLGWEGEAHRTRRGERKASVRLVDQFGKEAVVLFGVVGELLDALFFQLLDGVRDKGVQFCA